MLMVQPCRLLNITFPGIAKLDDCAVALVDGPLMLSVRDLVD